MKVVFLDRDGVINQDIGYLYKIEDFEFIDGIFDSCKYFQTLGYKLIVITNQSGIARGYYSEEAFNIVTEWMLGQFRSQGIDILDVFFCPHGGKSKCRCRKPRPGMLLEAQDKYRIDMDQSWMIGDKETDISAANSAGIINTILLKNSTNNETNSGAKIILKFINESVKFIK